MNTIKLGYTMGGERTIFLELFGDRSLVPVGDSSQHVGRKLRPVGWAGKKEKTNLIRHFAFLVALNNRFQS
jgi:hypothetical protein